MTPIFGCGGPATPSESKAVPIETGEAAASMPVADAATSIEWAISVVPATIPLVRVKEVRITIAATNHGTVAQDTKRSDRFSLDGKSSMELSMAFGNGLREQRWQALPPGDTVTEDRLGFQLVDAAGDHVIAIVRDGRELARTTLKVTP